jgi:hypothetical protein
MSIPGLRSWTLEQWRVAGDFVTEPNRPTSNPRVSGLGPIYVVQYRVAAPGIQLVIGGDSHMGRWYNFARVAGIALSTPELPISTWNASWGGTRTRTFLSCLDNAIDLGHPSVGVIQGWSASDGVGRQQEVAYEKEVKQRADRILQQGGVPVIVKALPAHLFERPVALNNWQQSSRDLDQLVPGALLFNPDPYVEDPQAPGDWRAEASTDTLHPNLVGSMLLRGPFERRLRDLL